MTNFGRFAELWTVKRHEYTRELLSLLFFGAIGLAAYYYSCPIVEVPITGRKRRQLLPTEISLYVSNALTDELIERAKAESALLPASSPIYRQVESVGNILADANDLPRPDYVVIESPEINAFVAGNNVVFVYTGILPSMENTSGMAMVLGHEMGHVLAGHGNDGIASAVVMMAISLGLDLFGAGSSIIQPAIDLFFVKPYQRENELEADLIGYALMSQAGFDRREAPKVYERMMATLGIEEESYGDDWGSTHPLWKNRIALLEELVSNDPTSPHQWIWLKSREPEPASPGESIAAQIRSFAWGLFPPPDLSHSIDALKEGIKTLQERLL